jgi:CheY-like chemotaxis protein
LVVEDDPDIRTTLCFALQIEGYRAASAANGLEALQILAKGLNPCLILLDLMMPVMNGREFLDALHQSAPLRGLPVVLVTAFGEQARELKVQGLIHKPLNLDALFEVVKKWCPPHS